MEEGAHGTHVASIAAGNRGVSREAWIAGVLISIPDSDAERRRSFYDSTRLAHAVDYLLAVADELAAEHGAPVPVSINVSLGTNGSGHDDAAAVSRWIDLALTRPGRSVCVASGNAGQERAEQDGDIGWVMGRVHSSGRVGARELGVDLEWNVVGNGIADLSENELEIWYGPQDRFAVQVKPPGQPWTDPVEPGQYIENRQLEDLSFLSVYNELYHPLNGANYIAIYLSPLLREPQIVGVTAGEWLIHLIGREVRDGSFHAWIGRDDPGRLGRIGAREAWRFPSFFSERSTVDNSTISTLACGQRVVAVANLDEARRRIAITSSQGPTRDGREKPDVAAPGTGVVAARAFAGGWVEMSGTSMASPYVAGVIGLMLGANPQLTGAQINGILRRTARPLPGASFTWANDAGSGVIDPLAVHRRGDGDVDPHRRDMKLTVFQAGKGDCLLLESADDKRILIDGGTAAAFRTHVAPALGALREAGKALDLIYLSHIDDDHIGGVLALLDAELDWRVHEFQVGSGNDRHPVPGLPRPPAVGELWHNGFSEQVEEHPAAITSLLAATAAVLDFGAGDGDRDLAETHRDLGTSVNQGIRLSRRAGAEQLGIPLNRAFGGRLALVRDGQRPVTLGALELTVIGPFEEDLELLRGEWQTWLAANQRTLDRTRTRMRADVQRLGASEVELFRDSLALQASELGDRKQVTAPNLASLMVLAQEGERRVLLTGDGHANDVLRGLEHAGHSTLHVDVLKLQHHGSEFNLTEEFCRRVTADRYVITGNGAHANPDLRALEAIIDARAGADYELCFNSSPRPGDNGAHMARVKDLVKRRGVRARFLTEASFTLDV